MPSLLRTLIVFCFMFAGVAHAAPKNYVLKQAELKKLKHQDLTRYMHKLQKAWLAYEKSVNGNVQYSSAEASILSLSINTAAADEALWCKNTPSRQCYAGGTSSCKGTSASDTSFLCKNPSPCGDNKKGVTCNPALFGYIGTSPICMQPDSSGYANITQRCFAESEAKKDQVTFYIYKTQEFLKEHAENINQFCSSQANSAPSWKTTCNNLLSATASAQQLVAENPLKDFSKEQKEIEDDVKAQSGATVSNDPVFSAAAERTVEENTKPSIAATEDVPEPIKAKPWCQGPSNKRLDFSLEKSGFIGRRVDGLKVSKDDDKDFKIANGTNCMMCGLKLACGDLFGNKINSLDVSFQDACNATNKALEAHFKELTKKSRSRLSKEGCENKITWDFAQNWQRVYNKLNKWRDNKENAKDLKDIVADYYGAGKKAGLFCADKPEQLSPENKIWGENWKAENFSPVVAVPARDYYNKKFNKTNSDSYQASLVKSFNLDAFSDKERGAALVADSSYAFLCGRSSAKNSFGLPSSETYHSSPGAEAE